MTPRVRRASPPVACAHQADVRDCGECVAAAHVRAVDTARALRHAAPFESTVDANEALNDAHAARFGHSVLRENGIAFMLAPVEGDPRPVRVDGRSMPHQRPCRACGLLGLCGYPCRFSKCPGRRVRCQVPEVRR